MPDLLEAIAEGEVRFVAEVAAWAEAEARELESTPEPRRLRKALSGARAMTRVAGRLADRLDDWVATTEESLREGVCGEAFRVVANAGVELARACLPAIGLTDRLWDQAAEFEAEPADVAAGRAELTKAEDRMRAMLAWAEQLAKRAAVPPPAIDPALIERGREQIRRGEFMTPGQAVEYVRRPRG